jgi:hypothetical protein
MGSFVKELTEVDETVADLYSESEDILQAQTAGVFAALIATGRPLIMELQKRLQPSDGKILAALKGWLELSKVCESTLEEITIPDDEDDEDPDDEDEDKDDEDDADEGKVK